MSVIGSKSCIFSETSCYSRENEKSNWFNSINTLSFDPRFPRNLGKTVSVSCKISGSGVGENPGTNGVSLKSKNKIENYNTAMKRLMRSPYEYHQDIGTILSVTIPALYSKYQSEVDKCCGSIHRQFSHHYKISGRKCDKQTLMELIQG